DPQGLASIGWQLGTSGLQRLRVELIDSGGQALQRLSFNASAVVPATAVSGGCDITIGKGGDFERLDSNLLARLLAQGDDSACICFLPGTHEIGALEAGGGERFRLSLHGCGHASIVNLRGPVRLADFVALELRDLVIVAEGELGVLLE